MSLLRDEYMLNKCTDEGWFVVELCESIRAHKVELANFELFSSTPKDVRVSLAGTYPAKEWELFGVFEAEDSRDVQAFVNDAGVFGKYVRVEVLSHHGSEHYCPVSMVRVYGVSELEIIAQEGDEHEHEHPHPAQEFEQQPTVRLIEKLYHFRFA